MSFISAGCTSIVIPPSTTVDPVSVYITDYGRHASLVLPRGDSSLVEYTYGDWSWYALGRDQTWRAPRALLLPNQGALGRAEWKGPATEETIRKNTSPQSLHEVRVSRKDVETLLRRLDARFRSAIRTRTRNERFRLEFVFDEDDYWMLHHSTGVVASWLRQLGCRVYRVNLVADFRVEPAGAP